MKQLGTWILLAMAVLLMGLILAGCGGGTSGSANVSAYLTDAASDLYDHVYITVQSVQISTDRGWVSIPSSLGKVDLLSPQFQFHQQLMGSVALAPGHYEQTRLILSSEPGANQIVLKGETLPRDLVIPSGAQTGLKLVGEFDAVAGQGEAIIIDFAPDKMIHPAMQGGATKYILRPTCPIVTSKTAPAVYGGLTGKVQPSAAWPTAVVTAYQAGTTNVVAVTTVTQGDPANPADTDGSFRLMLPAGDYSLKVSADGFETFDSATATPASWPVATGSDTDAGTITLTAKTTTP